MNQPMVSVIIPVFNDRDRLSQCLRALEQQTYLSDSYEVIVVDNGSKQSIEDIVELFPHATATDESQPGSYAARNRGLSLAQGEILAFTDADCIPASDWLEQGVKALVSDAQSHLVGGKIELFFRDPQNLTPVELYEKLTAFPQKRHIQKNNFTPTANLFTYRSLFGELGNFNAQLKSNGDREWCHRVFEQGYQLAYAEQAVVMHPARHSLAEIYRKHLRIVGGQEQVKSPTFNLDLIFGFLPPLRYCWQILSLKDKYSLVNKIQIILVLGILKYGGQLEKVRLKMGSLAQR